MFEFEQKKFWQSGRPSKRPDLNTLNNLYINYTSGQVAEMYGVSKRTVQGWFYRARKEVKEQRTRGNIIG